MSWLGDVVKFENFNLGNQWDKLKKNPERAFIGAMDEGSTKVWNKAFDWTAPITGVHKHYEPMTDYFGGASPDSYTKAQAAGINTGPARSVHNVAKAIVAAYAGGYGAGQLGAGGGAASGGTEAVNPATGLSWSDTGSGLTGDGGYGTLADGSVGGNNAAGADVYSGWSPSGSSASGSPSTLSPSSSDPTAYTDPYAAQDVMQQSRDTSAASGSPQAWDSGSSNNGASLLNKNQLLSQALKGMGGGQQQKQQPPLEIIKGQQAFLQQNQGTLPIQSEMPSTPNYYAEEQLKLAQALRNS